MPDRLRSFLAILLYLSAGSMLNAAVTLPLDGYCKPGRFFPIQIEGADAAHPLLFSAEGCVPSQMEAPAASRAIVPMLTTFPARQLHWPGGTLPLRQLGEDEKLIACTTDPIGDHIDDLSALFPGKRLVPLRLDASDLLPGPPVAWETLDGIFLDGPAFGRITDAQRSALLAGGVELIATGEWVPDDRWPWRKIGSVWVLSCHLAGPNAEVVNENIYAPTFAWTPGWSAAVRAQAIGIALLVVLLTLALMLRPSRATPWLIATLCILSTVGIISWRQSLGTVDRAGGDILVAGNGLVQRDAYVYQRARENAMQTVPWTGWTHPLFASDAALQNAEMRLHAFGDGQLSFEYQAAARRTTAFLRREVQPGTAPAVTAPSQSPMADVAKSEYLEPGLRILGDVPAANNRWAAVIIQRN